MVENSELTEFDQISVNLNKFNQISLDLDQIICIGEFMIFMFEYSNQIL